MTATFVVVVGVSRTSGSPAALGWAQGEARVHGGRVVAITAWRPPRPPAAVGAKPSVVRYNLDEMRSEADTELRAAVTRALGADSGVECQLLTGGRRQALLQASTHADLLVIDAPRRTDFSSSSRLARRLLHQASCPVVVMPPGSTD